MKRWLAGLLLLTLLGAGIGVWQLAERGSVPPRYNPWAPLDLQETPNWLTAWKLRRATATPASCLATLAQSPFAYQQLPDRDTGAGCGFRNAVRISRSSVALSAAFSLSCPAALSLALWETHVLQPAAHTLLGSEVATLEHFGSYACRGIYGREDERRSAHATADALDVAGFVLADGRRIRVLKDYVRAAGPADGAPADIATAQATFLRAAQRGACRYFGVVLGPEYNAAHRDHFHFERRGRYGLCR